MPKFLKNGDVIENVTMAGGLNTNKDPKAIEDYNHARSQNLFPATSGILWKRPGLTLSTYVGTDISSVATGSLPYCNTPLHLFPGTKRSPFPYLSYGIYTFGSDAPILVMKASGLDNDAPYATIPNRPDTLELTIANAQNAYEVTPICFCPYGNYTLFTGRFDNGGTNYALGGLIQDYTVPGSTRWLLTATLQFGGTQTIPVMPTICCSYKGRMRYFNFGPGMENWMVSADRTSDTPTTVPNFLRIGDDVLSQNGRHVEFGQIAGENITAAFEAQLQAVGSPLESCLVVLTDKSMVICTGDFTETTDSEANDPNGMLGDFVANKVNYQVGCVHQNTVAKTPYGYVWASNNDVWILSGNVPVKIGTNITQALQNTPPEATQHWTAAYCKDPGVYILDIITARGEDDRYLSHQQYWLQLNDAVRPQSADQARWFGPMINLRDTGNPIIDGTSGYHSGVSQSADETYVAKLVTEAGYGGSSSIFGTTLVSCTNNPGEIDDYPFRYVPAALPWEANAEYAVGDIVLGTMPFMNNGHMFIVAAVAGDATSGATEPEWDTLGAISDNNVTWIALEYSTDYRPLNYDNANNLLNLTEFRSKEYSLGQPAIDKQIKKVELSAFSSLPVEITVRAVANQGALNRKIGTPLFGQQQAFPAGVGLTDTFLISDAEFEGKTAQPEFNDPLVLAKFCQLRIGDGLVAANGQNNDIIIDDTNNKLVFGVYSTGGAIAIFTAEITLNNNGYRAFPSMDQLTSEIVTQMNVAMPAGTYLGSMETFDWSRDEIAGTAWPYFNNFKLGTVDWGGGFASAVFFGDEDEFSLTGRAAFTNATGTYDLLKSKRLLAILGFNTDTNATFNSTQQLPGVGGQASGFVFFQSSYTQQQSWNWPPDGFLKIYGSSQVANARTPKIALASAQITARLTSTAPLSFRNR